MKQFTYKISMGLARLKAKIELVFLVVKSLTGLNVGPLIPLILILLFVAIVLSIIASSSFLAPFVYPLF